LNAQWYILNSNIHYYFTESYWSEESCDKLAIGIYVIYLEQWLKVFPKENIHIIKLEEYSPNQVAYVEKWVLPFLGLAPYKEGTKKMLEDNHARKNIKRNNKSSIAMLGSTRKILEDFYTPFNMRLAQLLGDDKFLWKN
jgi:N-acetylgalactosamine 4-sulfate 6-O-sulfotransferase